MTTELKDPERSASADAARARTVWTVVWAVLAAAWLGLILYFGRSRAVSDRIRNPEVTGMPRPAHYLFGVSSSTYITWVNIGCLVVGLIFLAIFVWAWRRWPGHPTLLMALVTTILIWQDPIMNWAPFAVYNPQMWHWPEDWPLASLSPTVEPVTVLLYATFYLGPYFPAVWLLRRIQAKRPLDGFVWRHPLISLSAIIVVIGFILDTMFELFVIGWGGYIYSQVPPIGSIFKGTPMQFPLIWEASLVTLVMIPAAVLLYRDDTGRTVAEKLTRRARIFDKWPTLGMFVVMTVFVNVAYFVYGGAYQLIKVTRFASVVSCPWSYPDAKVYDPQGFYEQAGARGPYSVGIWSTWMSGQPNGRPEVVPPLHGGPCETNK
jgi:hypothetical protein